MPGEALEDAVEAVSALGSRGVPTVLTLLGEDVTSRKEVNRVVEAYGEALEALQEAGANTHLSVKPTQLGLTLGEGMAVEGLKAVIRLCREANTPVWIDMEGSGTVDPTLRLYRRLRSDHPALGICLQAALHRTPSDLESLLHLEPRIRLVKGAYAESAAVALSSKREVDRSFLQIALRLLERAAAGEATVVLGTHDEALIEEARREAAELGGVGGWEVHMLYGIREPLQARLVEEGVPLRVLISYGPAWFPWYMRRLAERPANLWFAVRGLTG
jgi:proline dehydrogenase